MNISPVSFYNLYTAPIGIKKEQPYSATGVSKPSQFNLRADTVSLSFCGGAPNAEALRKLLAYGIPDMYSDIILMDPNELKRMMRTELFSRPLKAIVKTLNHYVQSMPPVERQVFFLMKNESKRRPKTRLDEFLHGMVAEHSKKLIEIQKPIFEKLDYLSSGMPADLLEKYNYLIYVTGRKLKNEPVFIPFSVKEFKYKLGRIKERVDHSDNPSEKLIFERIMRIAGSVPDVSKEKRLTPGFSMKRYDRKQQEMVFKVAHYVDSSTLKNNKELKELIEISKSKIYKVPINIKFNRKSFIYELQKITSQMENKKLARLIEQTAVTLPTSRDCLSAFIMKAADRSSEQIGYDLLGGSVGTVDHLLASCKGGADKMGNYGLASAFTNSQKAHQSFAVMLRKNPEIRIYCQKHVDRLIELANQKIFKKVKLDPYYIISLSKKLGQLSPKENPLILDTSKLKY